MPRLLHYQTIMKSFIRAAAIVVFVGSALASFAANAQITYHDFDDWAPAFVRSKPTGTGAAIQPPRPTAPAHSAPQARGRTTLTVNGQAVPVREGESIVIKTVKNSSTGETISVSQPMATMAQLQAASPESLAQGDAALRARIAAQCSSKQNVFTSVAHEFPGEAGAFYAGLAMSAQLQMHGDPAALKHFYENNITNVMGHVSFAFFMLGSRMTTETFAMLGLHLDPCHALKNGRSLVPTGVQKVFGVLMGPLAMTGGFLISSMANEFLADPNIHQCAYGLFANKSTDAKPDEVQARQAACSQAYKDWVSTRKIVNYAPDLLSMTMTSFLQAYLINSPASWALKSTQAALKGVEKRAVVAAATENKAATSLLIRAISVAANFNPGGPILRFGVQAAGALVFVTINERIMPHIKVPFETWRQGRDVTGDINGIYSELDRVEKGGWVWTPKPQPAECNYEPTMWDYSNGYQVPYYCGRETEKISSLIDQLNEKYKKWREFTLAEAYSAHGNWKDYIAKFQSIYSAAHNFDSTLLETIATKNNPSSGPSAMATKLYDTVAPNGIDTSFFTDICNITSNQTKVFKAAAEFAAKSLDQLKTGQLTSFDRGEIESLSKVSEGLQAVDCTQTTASINAIRSTLSVASNSNGFDQSAMIDEAIKQARAKQVREALDIIYKVLNGTGPLATYAKNRGGMMIAPVYENPFFTLNKLIGDSRPQTAGTAFLTDLENDDSVIAQSSKDHHPQMVGNVATSTMSNYLLASMVCGPTLGQTDAVESRQLKGHKQSTLGWFLSKMGVGIDFDLTNQIIDSKSMIYVEFEDKDAKSLIGGVYGVQANFRPPMLVKLPAADAGRNLCQEARVSLLGAENRVADPRDVEFTIGGQKTKGLVDVVKRFADPSVFGDDTSVFENYWAKMVDTHVIKVVQLFKDDFKHIVDADYLPNFKSTASKEYNGRTFELGTLKSLRSQVHLNLLLLGKSLFPTTTATSPAAELAARRVFTKMSAEIEREMNLQLFLLSEDSTALSAMNYIEEYAYHSETKQPAVGNCTLRERMQKDFDANQESILALLKQVQAIPNMRSKVSAEGAQTLQDLAAATVRGIEALVTETGSYYGIIDTVHVEGLR